MSIPDYFQKAQALSQSLAVIDEPLKDSELISYILAGLGPKYDSLVTTVSTRIDLITIDDLYGYLLTHEQGLEHFHSAGDPSVLTANVAQRNNSNIGKYQRNYSPHSGESFGHSSGRGRGRGSQSFFQHSSNRPVCQICNRVSHVASKCYNRFDHSYQCEPINPAAFLTTQNSQPDLNWYPNTGSTNHLTNDLSNLKMRAKEYHGTDQIKVGNGQGLDILHTGLAQLPTFHRNFSLPNLLHVPRIEKNLISVNQFTHDNQVFIEFHPYFFVLRTYTRGAYSFKAQVDADCIRGHPHLLSQILVLLSLVSGSPLINGAIALVILLLRWCVVSCLSIIFRWYPISLLCFVLHVSKANCTSFILVFHCLFPKIQWIFFISMYGVQPLYYPPIINGIFCVLWMTLANTFGFSL